MGDGNDENQEGRNEEGQQEVRRGVRTKNGKGGRRWTGGRREEVRRVERGAATS